MTVHTPTLDDLRRYGHGRIWRSGSTDGCITTVQMNIHLSMSQMKTAPSTV